MSDFNENVENAEDICGCGPGTVQHVFSEEDFGRITSNGVAMIEFFAKWCGPCRATAPILETLAQKFEGRATVAKVDVDTHQNLATQYGVSAIPSIFLFDDGKVVERFTGLQSEETLADALEKVLSPVGV